MTLAWGLKVSAAFRQKVASIATMLRIEPSWLMAVMAFESAETFSSAVRNGAGSGAVGLIQFMPSTCAALGVTVEQMAVMTPEEQLDYVERYFAPWRGRMHSLGDVYGAVLWPGMIGKSDDAVIFRRNDPHHPALYIQNRGLDLNRDGLITKAEIVARVRRELETGLQPGNAYSGPDLIA